MPKYTLMNTIRDYLNLASLILIYQAQRDRLLKVGWANFRNTVHFAITSQDFKHSRLNELISWCSLSLEPGGLNYPFELRFNQANNFGTRPCLNLKELTNQLQHLGFSLPQVPALAVTESASFSKVSRKLSFPPMESVLKTITHFFPRV